MLWVRGIVFTVLVPGVVVFYLPYLLAGPIPLFQNGWTVGWVLTAAGAAVYLRCLVAFLAANGTPAIFFTKHLSFLLGEEPRQLVRSSLYQYSRNPMYLAVVGMVVGEAIVARSRTLGLYAAGIFVFFHLVVVMIEEPHLRQREGEGYKKYTRDVARWISWRRVFGRTVE